MNAAEEIERLASRGKKWEAIFAGVSAMLSTLGERPTPRSLHAACNTRTAATERRH